MPDIKLKMETAVPVLMDKTAIRTGSCRLSQIFTLRVCYNINMKRRLPGDGGPFYCDPRLTTQRSTEMLVGTKCTGGGDRDGMQLQVH